ncbi:glycoside hydrolase family 31 protein [Labilibaculum sp. K2S]|uniref:glycoside hydrolase family 31 protein n=1 Tax=Labilibaculum sp. K2S TaxID=3056386 RepID=UPI0025A41779|nr:TIM-barrel domain-containing protein [Labilibaculum sp. K2S]MDM8161537.1 glycoside hydrolase family 31 protein [Labilibaculum sp. K2S]
MKLIYLALIAYFLVSCSKPSVISYQKSKKGVDITLSEGRLGIYPIADNAVRIMYMKDSLESLLELVLTSADEVPGYEVSENSSTIEVKGKNIHVLVDKTTGKLSYANAEGKVFLEENADSRKLVSDTIHGEPCYLAEQSFLSPEAEALFGLGQFQDGNYNLKGVSRRLTQVNTQIALPFIYSNKGYGVLWHQYGLTDFNPADNFIALKKQEQTEGEEDVVEVTTTSGTQKVSRNQALYSGKFSLAESGTYSIFLDLGDMGNRHFVTIDGHPVLDQSNMWLPPTAGTLVKLKQGEHQVQVICKSDNTPKLSWKLKDNTTTFRSPAAKKLDYIVFYGPSADEVIASYRKLSGKAPLFPKWAYGFWQCRERYISSKHLVETVKEFRKRKLPMDVIVQDWQYWGNRGWGVPQFDETNYPNPSGFIKELHDLNVHFNISIWSNPDKNSGIGKEYVAKNRFVPGTKWLDYFNPKTRGEYWQTLKENMFDNGVDSWWMDAVEPENDALKGQQTYAGLGDFYRLTYPLMVSKAVYEGQRATASDKRVCILTRSAFLGQQRYGIINWSGDIGGTWDTFRRQIVAGLNYTITGLPYWTTDIGGFFRPGHLQYSDKNYHELLVRWFQWGVFNPIFRMHGYQSETEPWKYGTKVEENMRKMLNLRYALLPYIYSEAWQVTSAGSTMMRPLVMDFRDDAQAVSQQYEYMFGKSLLVAPITEAGINMLDVYLPKNNDWYDFWTGERIKGGQTVKTDTPLDKIPLFVKSGSILPMGGVVQYSGQKTSEPLEIRIYPGADGYFELYEDEGDNYNYEEGTYSIITFRWDNEKMKLTIGAREGRYPGMFEYRKFTIKVIEQSSKGKDMANRNASYEGEKLVIQL